LPRALAECLLGLWRVYAVEPNPDLSLVDENCQRIAVAPLDHTAGEVCQGAGTEGEKRNNYPHELPLWAFLEVYLTFNLTRLNPAVDCRTITGDGCARLNGQQKSQ
jgi:hypothetical protein